MGATPLTPHDRDAESLAALASDPDRSMIRKTQCGAALALLRRWGLGLLDPDVEVHKRELPKDWWLAETNTTPVPEGVQMHFPAILAGVHETLREHKGRPWMAYEVQQDSSVPKDEILLNLWYYLAAVGHVVEPKVEKSGKGFVIRLIVKE